MITLPNGGYLGIVVMSPLGMIKISSNITKLKYNCAVPTVGLPDIGRYFPSEKDF